MTNQEYSGSDDSYQRAIAIISGEHNWKEMCVLFAQKYPGIFVQITESYLAKQSDVLESERSQDKSRRVKNTIERLLLRNEKIKAIKYHREEYGTSLKESKETVEEIGQSMTVGRWGDDHALLRFVYSAYKKGGKVEAIKFLRSKKDVNLKDAKDSVEAWIARYEWESDYEYATG